VVHNLPPPGGAGRDAAADRGVEAAAAAVAASLRAKGHRVRRLGLGADPGTWRRLLRRPLPDAAFNLFEGIHGIPASEPALPALLESLGVPYTGAPPASLSLCLRKDRARREIAAAGVAVPAGAVADRAADLRPRGVPAPWIVKPGATDASQGIDRRSVTSDLAAARRRAAVLLRRYGPPVLLEEFLDGRELNVGLLGPRLETVLPLREVSYDALPPGAPPLLTYRGKWATRSREYLDTLPGPVRLLAAGTAARARDAARRAALACGCRGYARVDLRLRGGTPVVLEVNPNPDLTPGAGFPASAADAGLSHADLVDRILRAATGARR